MPIPTLIGQSQTLDKTKWTFVEQMDFKGRGRLKVKIQRSLDRSHLPYWPLFLQNHKKHELERSGEWNGSYNREYYVQKKFVLFLENQQNQITFDPFLILTNHKPKC